MSTWSERAIAIIEGSDPWDRSMKNAHLALVNERLDAEGLRTKVWGNMTYACERCGYVETREMEVGVEGPGNWREDMTYIATSYTAGRCNCGEPDCKCGGLMTHVNFAGDVDYGEPREASVVAVFRVPREYPSYPTRGIYDDGAVILDFGDSAFLSFNLKGAPCRE